MTATTIAALRAALGRLARVPLGALPTPLVPAPRFSACLGADVQVWLKRDDLLGPALGGNKVRKLQFLLADALEQGADCVITTGAAQSNHARLTAACARLIGLEPFLVLRGDPGTPAQGNLLLDRLLGAHVALVPVRRTVDTWPAMQALATQLRDAGRTPYLIPVGGSVPLGACAYAEALLELHHQLAEQDVVAQAIFHASSSAGTQAGLSLGAAVAATAGHVPRVVGVDVDGDPIVLAQAVRNLAQETARLLGLVDILPRLDAAVETLGGYAGQGYGRVSDAGRAAIHLLASTEGVFVDPVYSAKALAGLVGEVRAARFPPGSHVVFWHTGGAPALFAHAADIA